MPFGLMIHLRLTCEYEPDNIFMSAHSFLGLVKGVIASVSFCRQVRLASLIFFRNTALAFLYFIKLWIERVFLYTVHSNCFSSLSFESSVDQ